MKRILKFAVCCTALVLIVVAFVPLAPSYYRLRSQASTVQHLLHETSDFRNLQVEVANRKFKGVVITGELSSREDIESLERLLMQTPGVDVQLVIVIAVEGKVVERYVERVSDAGH